MGRPNDDQRAELVKDMRAATDELARTALGVQTRIMRQHGLTILQALVLRAVSREEQPPDMVHIAELTGLPPSTLTSVVDKLEERSLARRQPHSVDRRRITVDITTEGRALMADLDVSGDRLMLELIAEIPADDVRTTIRVVERLAEAMGSVDLEALGLIQEST